MERGADQWAITAVDFLGDNVTLTFTDPRDGTTYAALDHGHFGAKLHRSRDAGWEEIATPEYPPKPEGNDEKDMWRERNLGDGAHLVAGRRRSR